MRFKNRKEFYTWNEKMCNKYREQEYYNEKLISYVENKRIDAIISLTKTTGFNNAKILEVGCGRGYVLERIIKACMPELSVGIDISAVSLNDAFKMVNNKNFLFRADAESLPFSNELFDIIYITEVIEHTLSPKTLLDEARRVTRKGGYLIVTIPNEPLINLVKDVLFPLRLNEFFFKSYKVPQRMTHEWHLHIFTLKRLKIILKKADLYIKRIKFVPFLGFPLRYVVLCRKLN